MHKKYKRKTPCWLKTRPNEFKSLIWRRPLSVTLRTGRLPLLEEDIQDIPVLQIRMKNPSYEGSPIAWACHLRLQTWMVGPVHVADSSQLRECSEWEVVSFEGTTLVISLPGEKYYKGYSGKGKVSYRHLPRKVSVTFLPWKNEAIPDFTLEPYRISVYVHASNKEDSRRFDMDLPMLRFVH